MLTEKKREGWFFMKRKRDVRRYGTVGRACALFLMLLLLIALLGCSVNRKKPTDLFLRAIDSELTVHGNEIVYRVAVHLGEVEEDGTRDAEIVFLSPDSLSGMTVRSFDGTVTLERDGILSERERAGELLMPVKLLSPAEIVGRERRVDEGRSKEILYASDGRAFYMDVQEERLERIEWGELFATVEWIEAR